MRLVGTAVLVLSGAFLVALSVVNREAVTVRVDPFGVAREASVTLPLYAVIFAALLAGVVLGGIASALARRRPGAVRPAGRRGRGRGADLEIPPAPPEQPAGSRRRRPFLTGR